jgi:hypothetical protein
MQKTVKQRVAKIVGLVALLASFSVHAVAPLKEWTYLVYMAGANSLSPKISGDLRELGFAAPSPDGHILAFVNDKIKVAGFPEPRTRYMFQSGGVMIEDPSKKVLTGSSALDSGAPSTLVDAAKWAIDNYPSNKFVLIIWNHGDVLNRSGDRLVADLAFGDLAFHQDLSNPSALNQNFARGVCYNEFTGNYFSDARLASALSQIKAYRGSNIDILAFDACFMASVEIAYAVAPYVDYMVGSQNSVPGTGYAYATMLNAPSSNVESAGGQMLVGYTLFYSSLSTQYTLSLMRLGNLGLLVDNANALSQELIVALQSSSRQAVNAAICTAFKNTIKFDEGFFIDMNSFYRQMRITLSSVNYANKATVDAILLDGEALLEGGGPINVGSVTGSLYGDAKGLSVYFNPLRLNPSANPTSYSSMLWATNEWWASFLQAFLAVGICS